MINRALFIVLTLGLCGPFPVLHAADAPAKSTATKPPPYEKDIEAFEKADKQNSPPQHANLFVGSSTIRFWNTLSTDFPNAKTINRGFGGSQMSDLDRFADRIVIPYHPDHIFMYEGDNDIAAGKSPQRVFADFEDLAGKVHAALPDTDLYYLSIKPSPSRTKFMEKDKETNALIEAYCKSHEHFHYIDTWSLVVDAEGKPRPELFRPDMLHMNRSGYELWVKKIAPLVK